MTIGSGGSNGSTGTAGTTGGVHRSDTSGSAADPVLRVSGISGGYGDITVVRDVSLTVAAGSITALLGRNGAGKTTTLRLISGLNPIAGGTVHLGGAPLNGLPAHQRTSRGLAFVQEGKRIFRERTVRENLALGAYSAKLSRGAVAERTEEAFARFPALALKSDVPAGLLSGGQQQMLAIAQALAPHPQVLMLDEPTTGLAPSIVGELFELIRALRSEGLAVLLVEQAVDFCLEVADTAVVVNLGRVSFAGPTSDPEVRQAAHAAYLGTGAA